jgi:hypothetical protein
MKNALEKDVEENGILERLKRMITIKHKSIKQAAKVVDFRHQDLQLRLVGDSFFSKPSSNFNQSEIFHLPRFY